ncbi:hypothetical protein G6F22_013677 [Rhizopus arrhizus]|nr:hypothetical protein G6F22_013677 [Rhizopus arrhizus]
MPSQQVWHVPCFGGRQAPLLDRASALPRAQQHLAAVPPMPGLDRHRAGLDGHAYGVAVAPHVESRAGHADGRTARFHIERPAGVRRHRKRGLSGSKRHHAAVVIQRHRQRRSRVQVDDRGIRQRHVLALPRLRGVLRRVAGIPRDPWWQHHGCDHSGGTGHRHARHDTAARRYGTGPAGSSGRLLQQRAQPVFAQLAAGVPDAARAPVLQVVRGIGPQPRVELLPFGLAHLFRMHAGEPKGRRVAGISQGVWVDGVCHCAADQSGQNARPCSAPSPSGQRLRAAYSPPGDTRHRLAASSTAGWPGRIPAHRPIGAHARRTPDHATAQGHLTPTPPATPRHAASAAGSR